MKKFNFKNIVLGIVIGLVGTTSAYAYDEVRKASFSNIKFKLYGGEIVLKDPIVLVETENKANPDIYMPVREVLENIGYTVKYNSEENSINISKWDDSKEIEMHILDKYIMEGSTVRFSVTNNTDCDIEDYGKIELEKYSDNGWKEVEMKKYKAEDYVATKVFEGKSTNVIGLWQTNYIYRDAGKYRMRKSFKLPDDKIVTEEIEFYIDY